MTEEQRRIKRFVYGVLVEYAEQIGTQYVEEIMDNDKGEDWEPSDSDWELVDKVVIETLKEISKTEVKYD